MLQYWRDSYAKCEDAGVYLPAYTAIRTRLRSVDEWVKVRSTELWRAGRNGAAVQQVLLQDCKSCSAGRRGLLQSAGVGCGEKTLTVSSNGVVLSSKGKAVQQNCNASV